MDLQLFSFRSWIAVLEDSYHFCGIYGHSSRFLQLILMGIFMKMPRNSGKFLTFQVNLLELVSHSTDFEEILQDFDAISSHYH